MSQQNQEIAHFRFYFLKCCLVIQYIFTYNIIRNILLDTLVVSRLEMNSNEFPHGTDCVYHGNKQEVSVTVSQFSLGVGAGEQRRLAATCPKVVAIIQLGSRSDSIQFALLAGGCWISCAASRFARGTWRGETGARESERASEGATDYRM